MKRNGKEKQNIFAEFEALMRENAQKIYTAAYAAKGSRAQAEKLAEDMIFYGAKRSVELVNKERVLSIMFEKIGEGSCEGFEPADLDAIISRAMVRAHAWRKRKGILTRIGVGAAALLLCIGIALPFIPKEIISQTNNVILMENAEVIPGDYEISELVNYQRISKNLQMNEENLAPLMLIYSSERVIATVTAPDGTPYAMTNNLETLDGSNVTFTLFRGYKGGWDPVATAELGMDIDRHGYLALSEIYVHADADSNVFIFLRVGTDILIYKYDEAMETFEKKQTIPFAVIDSYRTMDVRMDLEYGEKGTAYIACNEAGSVKIYRYDTASDTLSVMLENMELPLSIMQFDFCVRNDTVYATSCQGAVAAMFYRLSSGGTVESTVLSDSMEIVTFIEADKNGTVHVFGRKNGTKHYIISSDLAVTSAIFEKNYYEDTDYYRQIMGLFMGKDGSVYCLENYYDIDSEASERSFLGLGRLDDQDPAKSVFVNGFDLKDNMHGFIIANGTDIAFPTFAYHDDEEYYIAYFHLSEIGKES